MRQQSFFYSLIAISLFKKTSSLLDGAVKNIFIKSQLLRPHLFSIFATNILWCILKFNSSLQENHLCDYMSWELNFEWKKNWKMRQIWGCGRHLNSQTSKLSLKGKQRQDFFANIKLEFSNENGILEILYLPLWTSQILNTLRSVMILINSSYHIVQWKVSTSGRYALVNEPIFSKWPMYDVTKSCLIKLAIQSARQINEF